MSKCPGFRELFIFCCLGLFPGLQAQESDTLKDKIVVVKLRSDDFQTSRGIREFEQLLAKAQEEEVKTIVFDINVKGYISWEFQERILERLAEIKVPTIAYVNSSATGAGSLIAVGSDTIYLTKSGIIGGAGIKLSDNENEEVQKREMSQQLSLLKARARSVAKVKGHRPELVEAFIDSELEVIYGSDVISKRGEILTLTAAEAVKKVADGKTLLGKGISPSIEALLKEEKLKGDTLTFSPKEFVQFRNQARLKTAIENKTQEKPEISDGLFSKRTGDSYQGKIVVLEVGTDALSSGEAQFDFMDRTLKKAQLDGATAVIFDLDTPGGYAWYTQGLILNSLQDVSIPTYSFVNTRAESAGAIVALGTDHIYMRPAASIGSALVVTGTGGDLSSAMDSKQTQMIISVVRNMAELKGHNPDIAEAFVTRKKQVKIGGTVIHDEGEVLNLNTIEATEIINGKPVLAKGIANNLEDLVKQEGLAGEIVTAQSLGLESFATWVQKFSAILIIIGIAGVYLEMKTPGFALPGLIGLGAFALYFFGNNVAGNLAGYELAVLFVLGLILIGVEIFLFPGAMIPALVGGLMVIGSLWLAMVDRVDLEWKWEDLPSSGGWEGEGSGGWFSILRTGFNTMGLGLIGGVALILLLMRFLPKTKFGGFLTLKEVVPAGPSIDGQTASFSEAGERESISYVGWEGEATTDLRPSGKGRLQGKMLDIITGGEFIPKGTPIVVSKHEGSRIVVKKA
ncbi:MAG: NfeD family protein [Verrucomicrobiales bacterium]|nr:NfeD family protein [Verrucomicrobiales bacterium]